MQRTSIDIIQEQAWLGDVVDRLGIVQKNKISVLGIETYTIL